MLIILDNARETRIENWVMIRQETMPARHGQMHSITAVILKY